MKLEKQEIELIKSLYGFEKKVYFVGVLTKYLKNINPIIVGGSAVEYYTLGTFATADIDLVSEGYDRIGEVLESWGFVKIGRHWISEDFDIALEIPSSYDEKIDKTKLAKVKIKNVVAYIIGIEDIVIDRLNAYVLWSSLSDGEQAKSLLLSYKDEIDWRYLKKRAKEGETFKDLNKILKELKIKEKN